MRLHTRLLGALVVLVLPLAACGSNEPSADTSSASTPEVSTQPGQGSAGDSQDRLIGYRLKRLDQLIEATFDHLLDHAGLTRRQWQALNTISRGPATDATLAEALRPFWEGNDEDLAAVVDSLVARGWVTRHAEHYTLTAAGHDAHAAAEAEVGRIRNIMAAGVTQQEFEQTMSVLARMTANLENELSE